MNRRLTAVAALVLALSACSSDEGADIPDDQVIQPADAAPDGFAEADIDVLTVSVPQDWEQQEPTNPAANIESTTWRGPVTDGVATSGLDIRVITDPQQPADDAATSLGISAMAQLGARNAEPDEIVWPETETAFYLAYEGQVPVPTSTATPGETPQTTPPLTTRTLVFDLADGRQIQITAVSDEGAEIPEQVLSSVQIAPVDAEE